jgi:hypothetical protein
VYRLMWMLWFVLILLVCLAPCYAAEARQLARPGSFVYYATYTVGDLVEQVTNNPRVARRYSEHFGVSPDKLPDYFKMNLKLVTLSKPTRVTTYFVSKHGRVLSKQRTLPAGRQVFVTVGDKLFLEAGCGNPLTKQMPVVKTEVKPSVEVVAAPLPEALTNEVAPTIVEEVLPQVEEVAALPPVVAAPIGSFRSGVNILDFVEVLAPVVAGLQYVQASKDQPPVVPEPASMTPVALASAGVAGFYIRRRRMR